MSRECFICVMCGTQFGPTDQEPNECPICNDERQYVRHQGQKWTTMAELRLEHRNTVIEEEAGLFSVRTEPKCAIGQRALLVQTSEGNLLWDCVPLVDAESVSAIGSLGGLKGIAVSHPHYYSAIVEWSKAFGEVPVYLHQNDSRWVMRHDNCVHFWEGQQYTMFGGLSLVCIGGHFEGFQVLHWPTGAEGRGVLLVGDQPFVVQDRRWVSFMYSYPNLIPLASDAVRNIADRLASLQFDRIYGAFPEQFLANGAGEAVERSVTRYLQALSKSPTEGLRYRVRDR